MHALLALLPIIFILVTMIGFRQPSKRVLPIALLITFLLAAFAWKIDIRDLFAYTIFGMLKAFDIIVIVLGAILIFNTMKISGALGGINDSFRSISSDHRVLMVIVGYLFVQLIEGAAGFGTPAAIAAPILIGLGVPPLAAACFALMADSTAVSFGAVGTPVKGIISVLSQSVDNMDLFAEGVTRATAIMHVAGGLLIPLIGLALILYSFGGERRSMKSFLEIVPFTLYATIVFLAAYITLAFVAGYETPSLVAAAISLAIVIPTTRAGFLVPKNTWTFPEKAPESLVAAPSQLAGDGRNFKKWLVWTPYVLIVFILVVTRIPALGLNGILKGLSLDINNVLGLEGLNYQFLYAYLPGTIPFILVAVISCFLFKMKKSAVKESWRATLHQVQGAAIALLSGVAMVQIMINSGNPPELDSMIKEIANTITGLPRTAYLFLSPLIGVLGAFISGSNTVSNILFAPLQYELSQSYGLNSAVVVGLQNVGGAIGNMICINNILAVLALTGLLGKAKDGAKKAVSIEGRVIVMNSIPVLVYSLLATTVAFILLSGR